MAITYIGSTLSVAQSAPGNFDQDVIDDYADLDWVEVGNVISIGELGDTSEDVTFDLLKGGRRTHVNGIRDVGDIPVAVEFNHESAGQGIIYRSVSEADNANDTHYWRIVDDDGEIVYFAGLPANYSDTERTASSYKGAEFQIRTQTALFRP